MKSKIAIIILMVVSIIIGLLICEFLIRLFIMPLPPKDLPSSPHKIFGWAPVPNKEIKPYALKQKTRGFRVALKFNSKGLRDYEYPYEKGRGVYRILCLGDSFTEAIQVPLEKTFVKILEKRLNSKEKRIEVINAGVEAYGTTNEYLFLMNEGLKYQPDMVLLCFYIGNDVFNNSYNLKIKSKTGGDRLGPYFIIKDKRLEINYPKEQFHHITSPVSLGYFGKIKGFISENSRLYLVLTQRIKGIYPLAIFLEKIGVLERDYFPDEYNIFSNINNESSDWKQAWEITERIILEMKRELDKKGIRFKIILIPFLGQVDEQLWQATLKNYQTPKNSQWSLEQPNQILANFCQKNKIETLDLLDPFKKYKQQTSNDLYFISDGHFNEQGHRLAAQIIYQNLKF